MKAELILMKSLKSSSGALNLVKAWILGVTNIYGSSIE